MTENRVPLSQAPLWAKLTLLFIPTYFIVGILIAVDVIPLTLRNILVMKGAFLLVYVNLFYQQQIKG